VTEGGRTPRCSGGVTPWLSTTPSRVTRASLSSPVP
jgi:hypothetical protein